MGSPDLYFGPELLADHFEALERMHEERLRPGLPHGPTERESVRPPGRGLRGGPAEL